MLSPPNLAPVIRFGVPTAVAGAGMHAVSGASVEITTVPPSTPDEAVPLGEDFVWVFRTEGETGQHPMAYSITGLPPGIVYSGEILAAGISSLQGRPTKTGEYLVSIIGHEFPDFTGDRTEPFILIIKVLPPAAFGVWALDWDLGEEEAGPEDDPDGDQLSNLTEYAFDLSPIEPYDPKAYANRIAGLPILIPTVAGGADLSLAFLRRKTDPALRYTVQFSEDLHEWLDAPGPEIVTPLDDTWDEVYLIDSEGQFRQQRRYVRVRVDLQEEGSGSSGAVPD